MRRKTAARLTRNGSTLRRKFLKLFLPSMSFSDSNSDYTYGAGIPSPISADDSQDHQNKMTVFAPGISPEKDLAFGNRPGHAQMDENVVGLKPQRSETVVTTDFETNDDLQASRIDRSTTSLPSSSKKGELIQFQCFIVDDLFRLCRLRFGCDNSSNTHRSSFQFAFRHQCPECSKDVQRFRFRQTSSFE